MTPLLILAGGKATRLKSLAQDTPKYLQPIEAGGEGRCFADFHLGWAKHEGFSRVILSVGHLGEKIETYCGNGSRYGLEISYLFDGATPLGTGGAVQAALKFPFTSLAITYGDTMLRFPVQKFLEGFAQSDCAGAMTVFRNTVEGHQANATLQGDRVIYDKLKPEPSWQYIDYGFLALRRSAIEEFTEKAPFDLALPLTRLSRSGLVYGYAVEHRFWEIGSPEALEEFRRGFPG